MSTARDADAPASDGDELDAGDIEPAPKPCLKPIHHENVSRFETSLTWCTEPDGHTGQCSGPLPSVLHSSTSARRLRGLQHDLFADKFEQRTRSKR